MATSFPARGRFAVDPHHRYRIIENDYVRDILDQPRTLEATLQGLGIPASFPAVVQRLERREWRRIVLTGMGSSFFALYPLSIQLTASGFAPVLLETSELLYYFPNLFDQETLMIVVSQSGKSAEIVRLLDENRGRAYLIAVTNTAASPLAERSNTVFLTAAGQEFSVSCKTYVTALLALDWLGSLLTAAHTGTTASALPQAAPAAGGYLDGWQDKVEELAARLEGFRHLFLVGRGGSLAAVGTGSLILKESVHCFSEGMSSAAFRHGPFEMVTERSCVLVFAGDVRTRQLNSKLWEDIRHKGGQAEIVGADAELASLRLPVVPASVLPILEILPVQLITLALAAQTGREAGRFVLGSKVTIVE